MAEQVEKINPDLVVRDEQGKPYTVRYEAVNAMLLNEFLKEHKKVEEQNRKLGNQERKLQEQETTIAELRSIVAKQANAMEALAAHVGEEDLKIQRVSAQLETSEADSQVVVNNR